jgi:hypothetical protein
MEIQVKHYVVLAVLLIAAVGFYIAGSTSGALVLTGLGVLLELSFWFGLFQRRRAKSRPA